MCILQDFEAITPNTLARTIETVEGGGMVVLLLKSMNSLKQLYTMTMVSRHFFWIFGWDQILSVGYYRMFTVDIVPRLTVILLLVLMNVSFYHLVHAKTV